MSDKEFSARNGLVVNGALIVAKGGQSNVGIGNSNPDATLHVEGTVNVASNTVIGGTLTVNSVATLSNVNAISVNSTANLITNTVYATNVNVTTVSASANLITNTVYATNVNANTFGIHTGNVSATIVSASANVTTNSLYSTNVAATSLSASANVTTNSLYVTNVAATSLSASANVTTNTVYATNVNSTVVNATSVTGTTISGSSNVITNSVYATTVNATNLLGNTTGIHTGNVSATIVSASANVTTNVAYVTNVNATNLLGNTFGIHTGNVIANTVSASINVTTTGIYATTANISGLALIANVNTTTVNAQLNFNSGANVSLTPTGLTIGNSTVNTVVTSTDTIISNSLFNTTIGSGTATLGNSTVYTSVNSQYVNTTIINATSIYAQTIYGVFSGNVSGNLVAAGSNTQVLYNDSGSVNAYAGFTFSKSTNTVYSANNITSLQSVLVGSNITNTYITPSNITINGTLIANSSGSNNALNLGGIPAANYALLTGASFTGPVIISNTLSVSANVTTNNLYVNNNITVGNSTVYSNISPTLITTNEVFLNPQTTSAANTTEGAIFYDITNHALNTYTDQATPIELGQQLVFRVVNKTGNTLPSGAAVYINGAQGNRPTVANAIANSITTTQLVGLVRDAITNNNEGFVTVKGLVQGYNATAFNVGDNLYLSATTAGALTNTAPTYPNYPVFVGSVLSNTNNGKIIVDIQADYNRLLSNTSIYISDGSRAISSNTLYYDYSANRLYTGNVTVSGSVTGNLIGTANNANNLGGIPSANYALLTGASFTGPVSTNSTFVVGGVSNLNSNVNISGSLAVSNNLTVTGNLTVAGATTFVNTSVISTTDKQIFLSANSANSNISNGSGIVVTNAAALTFIDGTGFTSNVNIVPSTYPLNLGSSSLGWSNVYCSNVNANYLNVNAGINLGTSSNINYNVLLYYANDGGGNAFTVSVGTNTGTRYYYSFHTNGAFQPLNGGIISNGNVSVVGYNSTTGFGPIGQYEMVGGANSSGYYNVGFRNDGTNFKLLTSNVANTQAGAVASSFNSFRPFSYLLSNDQLTLSPNTLNLSGATVHINPSTGNTLVYGIMYDGNNTSYYLKPSTTSSLNNITSYTISASANVTTNTVYATNINATTITANLVGTANNASNFNGQPASYYTNASNITTGTLAWAQAPTNTVNTTSAFTFANTITFNNGEVNPGLQVYTPNNGTTGGLRFLGNPNTNLSIIQWTNLNASTQWAYQSVDSSGAMYYSNAFQTAGNITAPTFIGGLSGTANNSNNLGGVSLSTIQSYITGNSATAYSNATSYVTNGGYTINNPIVAHGLSVSTGTNIRQLTVYAEQACVANGGTGNIFYFDVSDPTGNNPASISVNFRGLTSNSSAGAPFNNFSISSYSQTFTGNTQLNSLGVGTAADGTTGDIIATGNITSYYSDKRLKTIEKSIDDPLRKIKRLSGVYYYENDKKKELYGHKSDKRQVGVIAQEVEAVLPEIVSLAPIDHAWINDKLYSKTGENYKTVDYTKLVPLLIEGIKEQQKEIDELKNMINSLVELVENK